MTRPRDSQRSRVYRSEQALQHVPIGDGSMLALKEYVYGITSTKWWKNRRMSYAPINVRDGRGRRNAVAWGYEDIAIPRWGRTEVVVLHELAHLLTPNDCAAHGPEFAKNLLAIMRRFAPREAYMLEVSFKSNGVRYRVRSA